MTPRTSHTGLVSVQYPINIGYLVSYLKKAGIECTVRDFEVESFSEMAFLESVRKAMPSIIGFSCMTPHIKNGAKLSRLVKRHFPDILTVVGGVHASAIPEQTLREFPHFDVVVHGEGERTLVELYHGWLNRNIENVSGIAYRSKEGGNIQINPPRPMIRNLDEIPFPDRDLVDIRRYRTSHVSRGFSRKTKNIAEIICSRGCPYECIFCASKVVHSRKVRFRSPENIIAEMEYLINARYIAHFSFLDDTFTLRKDIMIPVCEYMRKRRVSFDAYTRVNDIDEEKISIMVSSGCKKISFGVESGSPKVLKLLKKGITVEQVEHAVAISRNAELHTIETTFMVGCHPDETLKDIEMTKKLIHKLKPDILAVNISIPYPGTELNRILKSKGLLTRENWDEFVLFFSNPSWELGEVPMDEIKRIMRNITDGYFLRPSFILRTLLRNASPEDLKYWFSLGYSFLKTRFMR
ncbi:B12-binding domain-containing radical SAM protein [Patescibacteria group bacterium]|nr:B12-binding domain-containing radical SAM protein [Patescibacteria group bacterium]